MCALSATLVVASGCYSSARIQPQDVPILATSWPGPDKVVVRREDGERVEVRRSRLKHVSVVEWRGGEDELTRPFAVTLWGGNLYLDDEDGRRPRVVPLDSVSSVTVSQKDPVRGLVVTGVTLAAAIPGAALGAVAAREHCPPDSYSDGCGVATGQGALLGAAITGGIALAISLALTGDLPSYAP